MNKLQMFILPIGKICTKLLDVGTSSFYYELNDIIDALRNLNMHRYE